VAGHDALDLGWVHVLAAGNAPRARIVGSATASTDPVIMLTAVEKVLARAGLQPGDVDVFEFAEAFAALCLRFRRDLDAGPERMNPNGGTIAMGHAFGATGAILLGCVADELERRVMTDRALAGRVAVVSGGGRGLGRSFCLALARPWARVVVNNRTRVVNADGRGPADHVVAEITAAGRAAVADYADAAAADSSEAMVATALDRWGRLDICVANAAIGVGGMFHRQSAEQFGEVLEINLHGSIRLARAAMTLMRPAG
jgi:hypothetical protein